jgi:peptidoglycan hydrolase-like protein with peptidoglycan-binding domain
MRVTVGVPRNLAALSGVSLGETRPALRSPLVHRRPLTAVVGLTALALVLTACSGGTTAAAPVDAKPVAQAPVQPVAEESPAAVESPAPEPSAEPTSAPSPAAPAAPAFDVAAAQKQLSELGYYLGTPDGKRGPAFRSAVMAFQKVQGIGADGTVGPATLAALKAPKKPTLKASSPANRVEVDLTKQVLYVVKGGAISRILPVSSGNGATYTQKDGSKARSLTPTGWYKIQRRIVGERKADLGTLYDPQYFYRGWAIHGSNSVPAYPASHGCIRVTRADAKWLLGAINNGMSVYLYGGTHTFTAGSSAPGTDAPTGDTAGEAPAATSASAPEPTSKPADKPAPAPEPTQPPAASPSPAARPSGAASPSPSATPVR